MPKQKPMGTFKNNTKASILSKEISHFHNRGEAIAGKIQTVLNQIREETEIKHLKELDQEKVQEIVNEIAERVENGEISPNTGATYISALNEIIDYTNYHFDKEIEQIHYSDYFSKSIDYSDKSISNEVHENFQNFLEEKFEQTGDSRFQALQYATELERQFGLRFRESAGLNRETIEKALESGKLELSREDWTKNAREREVQVRTEEQRELLSNVKDFLENQKSVNLAGAQHWKEYSPIASFRAFADYQRQEFSNNTGESFSFHGERHFWAQNMYSQLWEEKTGVSILSPIQYYSQELEKAGWNPDQDMKFYDAVKEYEIKPFWEYVREEIQEHLQQDQSNLIEPDIFSLNEPEQQEYDQSNLLEMPEPDFDIFEIDKEIRMEISEELGHSRLDITNTYLGHP